VVPKVKYVIGNLGNSKKIIMRRGSPRKDIEGTNAVGSLESECFRRYLEKCCRLSGGGMQFEYVV